MNLGKVCLSYPLITKNSPFAISPTINDLVKLIKNVTNSDSEIVHLPERAGDVKHSMAAVDKLNTTGFKPGYDFDSGMKATVEFFQSQKK